MAATTNHELTLHLPPAVIELAQRAAAERQESLDQIVAEALSFALQPVRQEALQRLKKQVSKQHSQPEAEIRGHLDAHLTQDEDLRLRKLLERNRIEGLTADEQTEMERLFDRIEAVATEKAAAIWLLSGKPADSADVS